MTKKVFSATAALVLLAAAAPLALAVAPTEAAAASKAKEPKPAKKPTVSAPVGKLLQEAQKLAQAKDFQGALVKAKEADALPNKSPYEEYVVKDLLGYLYANLQDLPNAATSFEAAIATGQMPDKDLQDRTSLLVKLYYQMKNWPKVVENAEKYNAKFGPTDEMQQLLASAAYNQGDYVKSYSIASSVIDAGEQKGVAVDEQFYLISVLSANKSKNRPQLKESLFRATAAYPKPEYWSDLFSQLLTQPGNNERTNLELFRAKLAAGQMRESAEYLEAAQTAVQQGLPGDAVRFLDKGAAAGMGGGARYDAQRRAAASAAAADKATLASQTKSAAASPNGNDDVKVAEAIETYGDAAGALALISSGITKPGIRNMDEARVTLGRIQLAAGQKDAARATFKEVKADPKMVDVARLWLLITK